MRPIAPAHELVHAQGIEKHERKVRIYLAKLLQLPQVGSSEPVGDPGLVHPVRDARMSWLDARVEMRYIMDGIFVEHDGLCRKQDLVLEPASEK
jgi:hypothetical protein